MWLRILFIILFSAFYAVGMSVFWFIVLFQIIHGLFTGTSNGRMVTFSSHLTAYLYQVLNYMTMQTEQKPFPFDEWPVDTAKNGIVKTETDDVEKKTE